MKLKHNLKNVPILNPSCIKCDRVSRWLSEIIIELEERRCDYNCTHAVCVFIDEILGYRKWEKT